ncbi:MarR family transcriptional regulator [Microbacterium paludicola]|uniref:MarR family transcriptional regulator n=2 Tax=Microbacterium paludicola TaxID=300019 RepID=A0A4Y9FWZ4_9MICO|nr:MarR family transcriptional regulator [Microbacterium paludicola]
MAAGADPGTVSEMTESSAIDGLEAAFATIGPIVKARMVAIAAAIHPDLRPAGWGVLRVVLTGAQRPDGEAVTVSDIVAETQMDKSVVSRQLRDLKEWGLVSVRRSDADARVFEVTPTPEAIARHQAMRRASRAQYRAVFGEWDEADVEKLTELLGRLAQSALHRLD